MKNNFTKINVHHVGGRDGEMGEFPLNRVFGKDILFHIYDSDESCMPQIDAISRARGINFKLHPFVVDESEGESHFKLNHCPCTSSLLPPAQFKPEQYSPLSLMGDYRYADAFRPVSTLNVPAITLDSLATREGFSIDFLSVDTQGSEGRVFQGAREQLVSNTVGVLCEVEMHELYKDQPLFGDIHATMRKLGFNFMRLYTREARVNFFRAGIGFRGDGMLMSADALFLRDPDRLETDSPNPYPALLKLAFISLSFGYVEYCLDCLTRVFNNENFLNAGNEPEVEYVEFLKKVWSFYKATPFIPQPSFADLYTVDEALRRFDSDNPHAWTTFDRDRVLRTYFSKVDPEAFQRLMPELLDPADTQLEALLRRYEMDTVADMVRSKRVKHASMTVESLQLGDNIGGRYRLRVAEELQRLGIAEPLPVVAISPEEIRIEANRLSRLSGWEGGPQEGWQYPFDLGHGIIARTYTDVQAELHPWRRDVLLNNLDAIFAGRYHQLSVLDLGACEGSMALALWERGVRDVTCVESRAINVEKARFVFRVKKADIFVVQDDVISFLNRDTRHYDLVLFMGLLYHLLDPFQAMRLTAQRVRGVLAMETVVSKPHELRFDNVPHYSPSLGGFFVRHDSALCNTAGLTNLELWPNREGLEMLLGETGFSNIREMDYGPNPISWYATKQRVMLLASRQ